MSDSSSSIDNKIDSLNRKLTLAKNLAWISGALFLGTVAVASWAWTNLTGEFIKYGAPISISTIDDPSRKFFLEVCTNTSDKPEENCITTTQPEQAQFAKILTRANGSESTFAITKR